MNSNPWIPVVLNGTCPIDENIEIEILDINGNLTTGFAGEFIWENQVDDLVWYRVIAETSYDTHYNYSYAGIKLDPYRILDVYQITHPAQQHAIKKLLRAGKSIKNLEQDIDEVIMTLQRWKEMLSYK